MTNIIPQEGKNGDLDSPELHEQSEGFKSLTKAPSKRSKSGKSAKTYRLERDAAMEALGLANARIAHDLTKTIKKDEGTVKTLQRNAKAEVDSTIFKCVDLLINQERLIGAELADGKFKLEFRL